LNPTRRTWTGLSVLLALMLLPAIATPRTQVVLDPNTIPKFVDPLPIPSALNGMTTSAASPLVITMSEFQQRVLPASMYPPAFAAGTYVWGYNGAYPGPTILALRGTPTHVRYVNNLVNPAGGPLFVQGQVPTDQTIHWANPLNTPPSNDPYLGPVPASVHLHGGEMPSAFDGGPDAWWTSGKVYKGPGYVSDQFVYPNGQDGCTLFYHDHALGMTRLNVYAGLAAFYLLLDPALEPANLPGGSADTPSDVYGHSYQMGLALQDKSFDADGQLFFDHAGINPEHPLWVPEFFGNTIVVNGKTWPYLNVEPRRYRFRMVNGSNARFYHMRLVREHTGAPGPKFWQIATDGGLLDHPVVVSDAADPTGIVLTMAPGERTEIVVDFSGYEGGDLILTNDANTPFPDGDLVDVNTSVMMQFRVGTTVTGGADPSLALSTATSLRTRPIERLAPRPITRALTLNEEMGGGGPLAMFVNNTMWAHHSSENLKIGDTEVWEVINLTADTHPMHVHLYQFQMLDRQDFDVAGYEALYGAPVAGMGPPLPYGLLDATTGNKLGGNPDVTPFLLGSATGPDANEYGWKDTFRMNPGQVTRIIVRVAPQDADAQAAAAGKVVAPGLNLYPFEPWTDMGMTDSFGYPGGPGYVWHCHITDHEDNEMMRPMMVVGPDVVTATLLARFSTEPSEAGVRVIWELSGEADLGATQLERGDDMTGPWSAVEGERSREGTATVLLDRSVTGQSHWYRLVVTRSNGSTLVFGPIQSDDVAALRFALGGVSPNPGGGTFRVNFGVAKPAKVRLAVLDAQGREVALLADGERNAGQYSLAWDGAGATGQLPAGMYFLRYTAPNFMSSKRIVITR
jgi:FtsP/CotA-like multicopper oxidase with cupredoxin domain